MIFLALALYLGELDSRIFQRVHRYAYNIITWSDELKLCYIQLRTCFGLDIHADEVIRMDYLKLYDPNCPGVFKQAHDIRLLRQYDGLLGWSTNLRAAEDYYYAYEVVLRKWRSKKKIKPFSNIQ